MAVWAENFRGGKRENRNDIGAKKKKKKRGLRLSNLAKKSTSLLMILFFNSLW
jgi:hypothetical protein